MSPDIVPFWQRLRPIASYPFRGAALYSVLALTLFIVVLGMLPFPIGAVLSMIGWLAAFKYAFESLRHTAHGRLEPPEVVLGVDDGVVWNYILLQLISVALPLVAMAVLGFGPGIALFVLFSLVQPAAIMSLAMTESLGAALNPAMWAAVVGRIGWSYLAVIGLLLVMQGSAANAGGLLSMLLPGFLAEPIGVLFSLWALYATFHLMGYLLWQYHEALGIEPKALAEAADRPPNRDRDLLDTAGERVRDGDPAAALALLREEMRGRAVSIEVHELYRRLLRQAGDVAGLADHGPLFLHLLLLEKQERRALGLARECLDADPDFCALEPEDSARLAERALLAGQRALALELLTALTRRYPKHPDLPRWCIRAADLLLREAGREAQARALLEQARARCGDDDPVGAQINAQLATLPA